MPYYKFEFSTEGTRHGIYVKVDKKGQESWHAAVLTAVHEIMSRNPSYTKLYQVGGYQFYKRRTDSQIPTVECAGPRSMKTLEKMYSLTCGYDTGPTFWTNVGRAASPKPAPKAKPAAPRAITRDSIMKVLGREGPV